MKVPAETIAVLDRCQFDGNGLTLPCQLDRRQYVAVNKVIEEAGGKWNRRVQAHLFGGDAAEIIDRVITAGEVTAAHKVLGYFSTPPEVVERLIEVAEIATDHGVLEPSAGDGVIVRAVVPIADFVGAVEVDRGRFEVLSALGIPGTVTHADFLGLIPDIAYDRVVMNPPFARQADIDHVRHALRFLRPGGRLVSVMSAGTVSRLNRKATEFRDLLFSSDGYFEPLPDDAFKASGTGVRTVIAVFPHGEPS